ncbi:unannotated protein [freshwater metagenome]|uniref:Unannotated protein n=1 Tax=freshwater metagenome TaxID=449393 RepID=A0A6J7QHL6_9ZZZZ
MSERKTSSRVGRRSTTSSMATPAASRARTASTSTMLPPETGADTRRSSSDTLGAASLTDRRAATASSSWARSRTTTSSRSPPTSSLSASLVPCAITRPWSMTTMSWASWSASSRYWVVSSTVVPSLTRSLITDHTSSRERGSSPVVGSSRKRMRGCATSDAARSTLRRMPPLNVRTGRSAASARSNRSRSSSARASTHLPGRW